MRHNKQYNALHIGSIAALEQEAQHSAQLIKREPVKVPWLRPTQSTQRWR